METRANHVLIGIFTLIGLLGGMYLFLWLAKAEADRSYHYFDVRFDSVSGLREAGDVRYNGLPVGQVRGLFLDPADPSVVRVRIEVDADVPVVDGTKATLEMQGVTGVGYVALSGGDAGAGPLRAGPGEDVPVIPSEKSAIATIFEGAPAVMEEAVALLRELRGVVTPGNRAAVEGILTNVQTATGRLDNAMADFDALAADLAGATKDIAAFTTRLDAVANAAQGAMVAAEDTLVVARGAIDRAGPAIDAAAVALTGAATLMDDSLPKLVEQVSGAAASIDRVTVDLGAKTGTAVDTLTARADALGAAAEARLAQAEATIDALNVALVQAGATLASVETASNGVTVVSGLAAQRLEEAQGSIAKLEIAITDASGALNAIEAAGTEASRVLRDDAPGLIADARATMARTEGIPAMIDAATFAAASVGGAADAATRLADQTALRVAQAEGTLRSADQALQAVASAGLSADRLMTGEGAALIADARGAMATANQSLLAFNRVMADDLPAIVADVRAASAQVATTVRQVGASLDASTDLLPALMVDASAALTTATDTFLRANGAIASINGAMASADTMLTTAQDAFGGVGDMMSGDVTAILGDMRSMASALEGAATSVAGDLPQISRELRETMSATRDLAVRLDTVIGENTPQLKAFMQAGLPQFVRFMQEGRSLMESLQRVTEKLERDPARFLLGTQRPEYRR
ncbi:MAG: phospholipid/cholesterol/gamma-HCH transport system substrate-binding protein [Paracoccaceae bacterium]|jgi:ABC-type transporter Mla subunit MlaD